MGLWRKATPLYICLGTSTYELNFDFRKIFIWIGNLWIGIYDFFAPWVSRSLQHSQRGVNLWMWLAGWEAPFSTPPDASTFPQKVDAYYSSNNGDFHFQW